MLTLLPALFALAYALAGVSGTLTRLVPARVLPVVSYTVAALVAAALLIGMATANAEPAYIALPCAPVR